MALRKDESNRISLPVPEHRPALGPPPAAGMKPTERLFVEQALWRMYPRLQRHDLFPWNLLNGPLIPDFWIKNTSPHLRRIVVIGCGDGILCNLLSLLFPRIEIVGIDSNAQKIARAKATVGPRKNLKFICGNAATMVDIPCDRIIYTHCLQTLKNTYAFRKLLVKTLGWLVNEGDFIVQESPLRLAMQPALLKQLWGKLRQRKSLTRCVQSVLGEVGYPNPRISQSGGLPGLQAEVFFHSPRHLTLTGMQAGPAQVTVDEWQDVGDQSTDSVVGFLFANQETDFSRSLG